MPKHRQHKRLQNWHSTLHSQIAEARRKEHPPTTRRSPLTKQPKGFQFAPNALSIFERYPDIAYDFMNLRLECRRTGRPQKKSQLRVELFKPADAPKSAGSEKFHNFLYKVRLFGRVYFVKELLDPTYPIDAVTQYEVHDSLAAVSSQIGMWNARVLQYPMGWRSRAESFLVSEWVEGVQLEKWLQIPKGRVTDEVYQRFLRIENLLKRHGIKDITTRNVLYNSKTDELVVIDLLPAGK